MIDWELLSLFEQESPIYNWFHYFIPVRVHKHTQNQHIIHNMSFNQIKGIINISSSSSCVSSDDICSNVVFVYIFSEWVELSIIANVCKPSPVVWLWWHETVCKSVLIEEKMKLYKTGATFSFPFFSFIFEDDDDDHHYY